MSMLRIGMLGGLRASRPITPHFLTRPASSLHRQFFTQLQLRKAPSLSLVPCRSEQRRSTASSVSGKPASADIRQAIQNARDEAHGVKEDLLKIIAATNYDKRKHGLDGFMSPAEFKLDSDLSLGLAAKVPKPILFTGLAGAIPYIFTAGSTLYATRAAGLLAMGHAARVDYDTALQVVEAAVHSQVTYGAVILSFLGAMHLGMEIAGYGGQKGYRRLAIGVAPVIFACSTLALDPAVGLVAQWVGFTGMWYVDALATTAGWAPSWYSQYRLYLSILIGTCMIVTFWGETYFNPVIETFSVNVTEPASNATQEHPAPGARFSGISEQLGEIETVEGDEYYVLLKKKETKEKSEGEVVM